MVEGYWGDDRYSEGVEVIGSLSEAPDELGLEPCCSNVNDEYMYWGKAYGNSEPVVIKDGSVESGNTVPANLFMYEVFRDTSVTVPDVGYSADQNRIFMEVLEGYDPSFEVLEKGDEDELAYCIAAKALMGDPDLMHHIGVSDGGYALIDPDRAGIPDFRIEEAVSNYIREVNRKTSLEMEMDDVEDAMHRLSLQVGIEDLDNTLQRIEPLEHQTPTYANFEAEFLSDNFRKAADGRPF